MKEASTEIMAAIDVQNRFDTATRRRTIQFPPPVSGGFVFGEQEYWAAFLDEGNNFLTVFRVCRGLSQKESNPTLC